MESRKKHEEYYFSLSLLEYESDLLKQLNHLAHSIVFSKILELVNSGKLYSLHIDVMRPPLIPNRSAFPTELIRKMYENFHERIILDIHLMANDPEVLVQKISDFIEPQQRPETTTIIQREPYASQKEVVTALRTIKSLGYRVGIGLNIPTSFESLTDGMVRNADEVLIMSVPMGKGGQSYSEEATERIKRLSSRFPDKPIRVDGGINDKTILSAKRAGARIFVIGSYVTMSRRPIAALEKLERILKNS